MKKGMIALIVTLCALIPGYSDSFLDLSTMEKWTIVISEDAIPSEKYAAEEFQHWFEEATGYTLSIANEPPQEERNVFIGSSDAMRQSNAGFIVSDLGDEDLRIRIREDNLAIAGGRPRGTLYGVYEFLERYLDVRFLTPDHTYVPDPDWRISWRIPCKEITYRPPFEFRWSFYSVNADHHDFAARLRVNTTPTEEKYGGKCPQELINHTFHHWLPVEEYGESHPEYFAFVDGERKLDVGGGGPQLCVTHPEVIEIVAEAVIEELHQNPDRKNISVSQNDNAEYCRCERCEKINQREGTPMGSNLAFVNAVAERVEKEHPDVKVGTLAYWYTRKPPKNIKPRDNVQIQLCSIECSTLYPINDPQSVKNRAFCNDMNRWSEICDDIWIWNYNTAFNMYDMPFPNLRAIGPNVKYFLKNNAKGVFMQANGNGHSGEMSDLRNYVMARLLWNPSLDGWELVEEFCHLHYKSAAQTILDYLSDLHDHAEAAGYEPTCFPLPFQSGLSPEFAQEAMDYFKTALKLADNEEVRARVEKASICAHRAVLELCGQLEIKDGHVVISHPAPYSNIVEEYKTLCRRYNMDRAAERTTAEEYFQTLDQKTQEGVPAQRLENETWRLTFVPQHNGRMIEMVHKPTHRNLLYSLGQLGIPYFGSSGTFEEEGVQGYDHQSPHAFKAEREENTLRLTKTLADDSQRTRTIQLPDDSQNIVCKTELLHKGEDPKTYQIKVDPEFFADSSSNDASVVSAYVKNEDWVLLNQDWSGGDGPKSELLSQTQDEYAFFNHEEGFGVKEIFSNDAIERLHLWWNSDRGQINLQLITPSVELKSEEEFAFTYEFEYLSEPPSE